jgi:hypothetical protein
MFKPIGEGNSTITPFKVFKEHTFTEADSGSGVFTVPGTSGSFHNFNTGSATSKSIGTLNSLSESFGKDKDTWYSVGTFYNLPVYNSVYHLYYKFEQQNSPYCNSPQPQFSFNQDPWPRDSSGSFLNKIHQSVNVFNIPRKFFGEEIKPGTVQLVDNSLTDISLTLVDDTRGHLYESVYSSSFARRSSSLSGSNVVVGDAIGNVFYDQGLIVITDTGSRYGNVGTLTGTDGWSLKFQGTKTIREYEYLCNIQEYEYNGTDNISATPGRSGSQLLGSNLTGFFMEGIHTQLTGSVYNEVGTQEEYDSSSVYRPSGMYENFVTHSEFNPYVTSVGLYNDQHELLAVAKLSRPIKKPKEYDISFTIRFDN